MTIVYGIPNCDSVKKALDWFKRNKIPYSFHDYKKQGISLAQLQRWSAVFGHGQLLNTKGTTWRGLDEGQKALAQTPDGALQLMEAHTSLIKRPVIEQNGKLVLVGFDAAKYTLLFQNSADMG